jgi:hypothetical protein
VHGGEEESVAEEITEKKGLAKVWSDSKWIIIAFIVLFTITLPCACFLGYRTNWILWSLGLR